MTHGDMPHGELDGLLNSPELAPLPADRLKQIENAVIAKLQPVRALAPDGVYLAGFLAVFIAVWVVGCYFTGQRGWHALSEVQRAAVFVPLAAIIALLAVSLVHQMRPAAKHVRSSALASASLFIFLVLLMTVIFHPAQESDFIRRGLVCFRIGVTSAIPAAFFFALLLSRGAALSPALTGATAGGLAGLVGLAVLEINCPNLNVYHIVVWHISVSLVCAIAGLVFASVTFRRWLPNK